MGMVVLSEISSCMSPAELDQGGPTAPANV